MKMNIIFCFSLESNPNKDFLNSSYFVNTATRLPYLFSSDFLQFSNSMSMLPRSEQL